MDEPDAWWKSLSKRERQNINSKVMEMEGKLPLVKNPNKKIVEPVSAPAYDPYDPQNRWNLERPFEQCERPK